MSDELFVCCGCGEVAAGDEADGDGWVMWDGEEPMCPGCAGERRAACEFEDDDDDDQGDEQGDDGGEHDCLDCGTALVMEDDEVGLCPTCGTEWLCIGG